MVVIEQPSQIHILCLVLLFHFALPIILKWSELQSTENRTLRYQQTFSYVRPEWDLTGGAQSAKTSIWKKIKNIYTVCVYLKD